MNRVLIQHNAAAADRRDAVVCPKPRRVGPISDHPIKPLRPGNDVLDLLLFKGGCGLASSPPFLCGSPPSRVANPLIQDARFAEEKLPPPLSPPSGGWRGGRVRGNFGNNPTVRIEGFDCDRRNRSIAALA